VTYNTQMAYGASLALQREGWKVPADIGLASADVSRLSIEGALRITGAGTSPDKLGEAAARLVLGEGIPTKGLPISSSRPARDRQLHRPGPLRPWLRSDAHSTWFFIIIQFQLPPTLLS